MAIKHVRVLFILASLYDGLLGGLFLAAPAWAFEMCRVTPPNHWGYVRFPAALLIIFALMFLAIAVRPFANRNLIFYGLLLKGAYSGLVFWYWARGDVPWMWKPFAIADVVFALLFVAAYWQTRSPQAPASPPVRT